MQRKETEALQSFLLDRYGHTGQVDPARHPVDNMLALISHFECSARHGLSSVQGLTRLIYFLKGKSYEKR